MRGAGLAPSLGKHMGVNVVVETVPGPDGWNRIYQAKLDGYTIGIGDPVGEFGNGVVNPVSYSSKPSLGSAGSTPLRTWPSHRRNPA